MLSEGGAEVSNNSEFIHANPQTTEVQRTKNVTNGCINLSMTDRRPASVVAFLTCAATEKDLSDALEVVERATSLE